MSTKVRLSRRRYASLEEAYRFNLPDPLPPTSECWIWQGSFFPVIKHKVFNKYSFPYGRVHFNYKTYKAHRLAFMLCKGSVPEGMYVCHSCDNPKCVNPDHLFLGSGRDNALDMLHKGRHNNGRRGRKACPRGHPYDENNTKVTKEGKRICRICANAATAEWMALNKERAKENGKRYYQAVTKPRKEKLKAERSQANTSGPSLG